jgi:hypothetical protein
MLVLSPWFAIALSIFAFTCTFAGAESHNVRSSGYALTFDGVDDFASVTLGGCGVGDGADVYVAENVTLSAWVKLRTNDGQLGTDLHVVGAGATDSGPRLKIGIEIGIVVPKTEDLWKNNEDLASCSVANLTHLDGVLREASVSGIADGQWHHIASSYDRHHWAVYIDGAVWRKCERRAPSVNKTSAIWSDAAANGYTNQQRIHIGIFDTVTGSANAQAFDGEMDEIRVFNRRLQVRGRAEGVERGTEESEGGERRVGSYCSYAVIRSLFILRSVHFLTLILPTFRSCNSPQHAEIVQTYGRGVPAAELLGLNALLYLDFDKKDLTDKAAHASVVGSLGGDDIAHRRCV